MAKITLTDIASGFNPATINANFTQIENELNNKVLYRNNPPGEPNQMSNILDMNNQRIINLPAPSGPLDPVRQVDIGNIQEEVEDALEAASQAIAARDVAVAAQAGAVASANSASINAQAAQSSATNAAGSANSATGSAQSAAASAVQAANASRLTVGTTTTSAPGSNAEVQIQGVPGAQIVNFTIPRGTQGPQGIQGIQGPLGPSGDGTGDVIGEAPTTIGNLVVWGNVDGKYIVNSSIPVADVEQLSNKGQPFGYAPLDENGYIPEEYINVAPEVSEPILVSPVDGAVNQPENPLLVAGGFFSGQGATHQSSQFQVATNNTFASIVFDTGVIAAATQFQVPVGILTENTGYAWRVRYQNSRGVWSPWSDVWEFTTLVTFNSFIPVPAATPAIGAAFRGGYYGGSVRQTILESTSSRVIAASGSFTFVVNVDMDTTPTVYAGQSLRVKEAGGTAYMDVTVTGARGTTLTVTAVSASGSGTFTSWYIQAVYRIIVAPAAGRPATPTSMSNNVSTARSITDGWNNTLQTISAGSAGAPAQYRAMTYNGYNDWYMPSRDEGLVIAASFKQNTFNNDLRVRLTGGASYPPALDGTRGDIPDITNVTLSSENRNSVPASLPTATVPGQTPVVAFQTGGSEALPIRFATSTRYANNTYIIINNQTPVGPTALEATAGVFATSVPVRREII